MRVLLVSLLLWAQGSASADTFELSPFCPPALRLDDAGRCTLHSQYQAYGSLYDKGVGGLKTGLPPVRDGFTPQQIDLGRLLFFDPLLSRDGSVACSSCHDPALGFSDGRARSVGVQGTPVQRSAPSLWNVAFLERLLWDGSKQTLEEQLQGPLYAPNEMGGDPQTLLTKLQDNANYRHLFASAFDDQPLALDQVYTALAAFESSLISLNSRYDLYAHGVHSCLLYTSYAADE